MPAPASMPAPATTAAPVPELLGMGVDPRPEFTRSVNELQKQYDVKYVYTSTIDHFAGMLYEQATLPTISAAYFAREVERHTWNIIFRKKENPPAFPFEDKIAQYGAPYSQDYLAINLAKFLDYVRRVGQPVEVAKTELDNTQPGSGLDALIQGGLTEEAYAAKLLELQAEVVKISVQRGARALKSSIEAMPIKLWKRGITKVLEHVEDPRFCCFTKQQIVSNMDVRIAVGKLMPHYVEMKIEGVRKNFMPSEEMSAIEGALYYFVANHEDRVGSLAGNTAARLSFAMKVFFKHVGESPEARAHVMEWQVGVVDKLNVENEVVEYRGNKWGEYVSVDDDEPTASMDDDELTASMGGLSVE